MAVVDIRQVMASFLTFSMFVMLVNMIRTDYFDSPMVELSGVEFHELKVSRPRETKLLSLSKWPKNVSTHDTLKPCWTKLPHRKLDQERWDVDNPKGFIIFSLTGGHEHHLSQVTNAIVVARRLRAILVLPEVIVKKSGERRKFGEIYDVHKIVTSLEGVVKISITQPAEVSSEKLTLAKVPNGVSEDYVTSKLEPLFKRKGNLKIVTYFPTSTITNVEGKNTNSLSCLAMFETLQLKAELQEAIHSMVETLRTSSQNSDGLFIAVDFRDEMLGKKGCQGSMANGRKSCYSAQEIGQFLKKVGIQRETTIYLTVNGWHDSLNSLTEMYPNVHTKENLIPAEKVVMYLNPESSVYKKIIDYYICSWSDIYIPAKFDLFYASVVGERIAAGETPVLEPAELDSTDGIAYISPYMWKKSHLAYSCFC